MPLLSRRIARGHRAGALALGILSLFFASSAATAATGEPDDPALEQHLAELAIVHGDRVLDTGHVDLGPRFDAGQWRFLVHDDLARADAAATSVWRYPDETVMHVSDAAAQTVPDDPAYAFLGVDPGATVWVVPQTQNPDVVWIGWNTQDPEVMRRIDRGITLSLTAVEGPGSLDVYLQSGSFGEPQVLFDSEAAEVQSAWVDVNTHTHANWVFSEPGVYLVHLRASADLIDGSKVEDTQVLRFAVGADTPVEQAFAATPTATAGAEPASTTGVDAATTTPDPLVPILLGAIALVTAGLMAGAIVAVVRGRRARRRVLAARGAGSPGIGRGPRGAGDPRGVGDARDAGDPRDAGDARGVGRVGGEW